MAVSTEVFGPITLEFTQNGNGIVARSLDKHFFYNPPLPELKRQPTVLSDSGRYAATLKDGVAVLLDTKTGDRLFDRRDAKVIDILAVSDDGNRLVVKSHDNSIRVWNSESPQSQIVFEDESPGAEFCTIRGSRALTKITQPGGSLIRLWDTLTGQQIFSLERINDEVFNSAGTLLAVGRGDPDPDNTIEIWDAIEGKRLAVLAAHLGSVESVAFSPDGLHLASGSVDHTVIVWNAKSHKKLHVLHGHDAPIRSLQFSPDNTLLASAGGDDQSIRFWNVENGLLAATLFGHTDSVTRVAFNATGNQLASMDWDGSLRLWDVNAAIEGSYLKHETEVIDVAISRDGDKIVSSCMDGKIRMWDCDDRTSRVLFDTQGNGHLNCFALSPNGEQLAFNRGWIEMGSDAAGLNLLNLKTGEVWLKLDVPRIHGFLNLAFTPDSSLLAAGGQDGIIRIWETNTGNKLFELKGHAGAARAVSFNSDGTRLASGCLTLRIWDMNSKQALAVLAGHHSYIYEVAFSPDDRLVATASHDRTVRVWNSTTFEELAVFPHGNHALSLCFSPDGTRLMVGCRDSAIHVWDVKSMKKAAILTGHEGPVHGTAFSTDGTWLASSSFDGTVRIWDSVPARLRVRSD